LKKERSVEEGDTGKRGWYFYHRKMRDRTMRLADQ
jgi:hypothetical protein